jgi:uncharacterized integral membrane protein
MHHAREYEDINNPPSQGNNLMGRSNSSGNVSPELAYANRVARFMRIFEIIANFLMFLLIAIIISEAFEFLVKDWESATCNLAIFIWILLDFVVSIFGACLCVFRIIKILRRQHEQTRRVMTLIQNLVSLYHLPFPSHWLLGF